MDQRLHPRVPIILSAALRLDGGQDFPCLVTDLSEGGAGVTYLDYHPDDGRSGQLLLGEFGDFISTTLKRGHGKAALRFGRGEAVRNRLLNRLILFVEEGLADMASRSRWPSQLSLTRSDGNHERCDVLDINLSGVRILTSQRPVEGELVRLGRMYGRVSRHLADGIEVSYLNFVNSAPVGLPG